MSLILGFDVETTGLDVQNDDVIEVGMVLWNIEQRRPVRASGFLVKTAKAIPEEVTKVNGLTNALLDQAGLDQAAALQLVLKWVSLAEAFCAHNGRRFDKPVFEAWCKRHSKGAPERVWIDTMLDLPVSGHQLQHMAADQGFLNPFPHMAVTDVLTMLRIMDGFGAETALENAKLPEMTVRAVVGFKDNQKAKNRGYRWDPDRRWWVKTIKVPRLEQEQKEADFEVVPVEENVV